MDPGARNRLLAAVPADVLALLDPMHETPLQRGDILVQTGSHAASVYFPHDGLVSLMVVLPDGAAAEAACIGREGMIGHPFLADFAAAPARAVVQMQGRAARVQADVLYAALARSAPLRDVIGRYARVFLAQMLQSVACSTLHGFEERLARWLLQSADRVGGDILFTHEFLAEMLGASRPTVSLTARAMQTAGLIRYRRGQIEIVDRQGLEDVSCPCYRIVRRVYDELLPLTYA